MELAATLSFLLGLACAGLASPTLAWSDDDVAVMALYSADYYNKVSREDVLYRLVGDETEYVADENSGFNQLSFLIQETICHKSDNTTDGCTFKEGGVVKSCTSHFFMEDNCDVVVVTCQSQDGQQKHSRVRRSSGGRPPLGRGGRRPHGRPGSVSVSVIFGKK